MMRMGLVFVHQDTAEQLVKSVCRLQIADIFHISAILCVLTFCFLFFLNILYFDGGGGGMS